MADTPRRYRRVRDWVQAQTFPEGPVLYHAGAGATREDRKALTVTENSLKNHFGDVTPVCPTYPVPSGVVLGLIVQPERDWEALGKQWGREK